jgi:hypothetical protein
MFYEIVSAMQLSEIKRVSGSVDLRVVPHGETFVMSEGIEDKEQASEVALTPGIGAQGSRRWHPWISLLTLFMMGVAAAAEPSRLVIFDNDFFGPASTNLQAAVLLLNNSGVKVLGLTVVSSELTG